MEEITRLIVELMKLLQNMSESEAEDDNEIVETVDYEVKKIKEELGSWFIDDWQIYQAS